MELANLSAEQGALLAALRPAVPTDASDILALLRFGSYRHTHADWRLPVDWIGTPGFVVLPQTERASGNRFSSTLFGPRHRLRGCLAATADPLPAAWVRLAGIADETQADAVLEVMVAHVCDYLRATAATQLAWLVIDDWPNAWLPGLGFACANQIETYFKRGIETIPMRPVAGLEIRPAQASDMAQLASIEAAAFEPLWRHSAETLELARRQAMSFDVALLNDQIVGFQFSARSNQHGAHLSRLTVSPEQQGSGIGSALLAHALTDYRRRGLRHVSLNTQVDNLSSQRLYLKFGFYASGERVPVWVKTL